jgi:hypothetical protein
MSCGLIAPARNPARANSDALSENPGAPAIAKPANTTLPVMLATKTRPSSRIEIASTTPVTTVSSSSRPGSGPKRGSPIRVRDSQGRLAGILGVGLVLVMDPSAGLASISPDPIRGRLPNQQVDRFPR